MYTLVLRLAYVGIRYTLAKFIQIFFLEHGTRMLSYVEEEMGSNCTLLKNLTDEAIAQLYVTKCSTISLYLTKLYVA